MIKACDNVFLDVNDATNNWGGNNPNFLLTAQEFSKQNVRLLINQLFSLNIPLYGDSNICNRWASWFNSSLTPATASDSKEIIVMTIEEYSDSDSQDYSITMEGASNTKKHKLLY
jgi:hypothetical protein